jgi:hypothetical protein
MCFQFSVLNIIVLNGCHLKGRAIMQQAKRFHVHTLCHEENICGTYMIQKEVGM